MNERRDASSQVPWPPVVFGFALACAGLLTWLLPLPFSAGLPPWTLRAAGGLLVILAIGLIKLASDGFRQAGTAVLPTRPATAIVASGAYRVSRNPMYLAQVPLLAGVALLAGSAWFALAIPAVICALQVLAVNREEAYLERKFGAAYLAYKSRVRRWL